MKKLLMVFVIVLMMLSTSACYWNQQVEANQIGLALDDGVSISDIRGPGRWSAGGWFSELKVVDGSVKTITWSDPSQVTEDKQPIGMTLTLSYKRQITSDSLRNAFTEYNAELFSDEALQNLVVSKIPTVTKDVAPKMSLDEMLSGRSDMERLIFSGLQEKLSAIYIDLVAVQVADIAASQSYMSALEQKSLVILARETAVEQVKTAEQNLLKEKSQTEIEIELARRQNLVNQELAKVYEASPEYLRIRELELLSNIIGPNDKLIFVPAGSPLSVFVDEQTDIPAQVVTDPQ